MDKEWNKLRKILSNVCYYFQFIIGQKKAFYLACHFGVWIGHLKRKEYLHTLIAWFLPKKKNTIWKSFWFEGNLYWGQIDSADDWKKVKDVYWEYLEDTDLSSARRFDGEKTPYFGFRRECNGKETLGEFAKKNGMKI